ncbi:winged helix-turn-helix domain-containing protein [Naasia lichenicola]|uniref:GAF domain-containing protein n=1 Tax=Naasia lichenicola TaxID=2565933 RepID=A0A4S4FGJ4_9MICO|nr:winged helix-turn-helix domain-containing protein [Naasia lichenicola]THG29343.1 GAF domain-containing protein [Naasia lichenicola]
MSARDAAVLAPTVLCAEAGSAAASLPELIQRKDWPSAVFIDAGKAANHASVRDTRLVVVGGNSFAWVLNATKVLRLAGPFPIAVVGVPLTPDQVLSLLDAGANLLVDSIAQPREALARLIALCRGARGEDAMRVRWLQSGDLRVDLGSRRCLLGGESIPLSQNEFDLLAFLMMRAQQTVTPHEIVQQVWNWHHGDGMNTLRIHIGRLRKKLHDSSTAPSWIGSSRGVGYQFLQPVAEVGEDRSEDRLRQTVATLNAQADALYAIVDSLRTAADVTEIAELVVEWAVGRNFSDAATVFRLATDDSGQPISSLVSSTGMSSRWRQALATGHPVRDGFMGAHAYASGEVVQLSDVSKLSKRFPVTARMSSPEDLHACLLFPLFVDGVIWGDLAFVSRTAKAFNPSRTAYLRSIAGLISLALAAVPSVLPEATTTLPGADGADADA